MFMCCGDGGAMNTAACVLTTTFIIVACIAIIVYLISLTIELYEADTDFKMPLKSFKQFYFMDPGKYNLHFGYATYCAGRYNDLYYIKFNCIDVHLFIVFMLQQQHLAKHKEQCEKYLKYVQLVKQDINQYENQAQSELNKMIDNIEKYRIKCKYIR